LHWHVFSLFDRYFLFDTPSNSLFSIDYPVYHILRECARAFTGKRMQDVGEKAEIGDEIISPELIREAETEIAALKKQGFLQDTDPFLQNPQFNLKPELKALCLHLAHDCQLRCIYCFAGGGAFGGDRSIMSQEVGEAAIRFLVENSGNKDHLEVDFFGGEPLLNKEVMFALVDYGEEIATAAGKRLHFTLTTNTLELDKKVLDFLRKHRMGLILSLDGRSEVNDRTRGRGTHDRIVPRILEAVQDYPDLNHYVRGTYTRYNLDFSEDVKHFYNLGIRSISIEPVTCDPKLPFAIQLEDLPVIYDEYDRLARFWWETYAKGDPFKFFHFNVDLEKGPCLPKRLLGCGAGFDYLAVTPQGKLYPCHQFVGEDGFLLGDVFSGIKKPEIREEFGQARLYKKEGCSECWARYYCSGNCHANAYFSNGSILKPDHMACELLKKRLECGLALKAMQMEAEGEVKAEDLK